MGADELLRRQILAHPRPLDDKEGARALRSQVLVLARLDLLGHFLGGRLHQNLVHQRPDARLRVQKHQARLAVDLGPGLHLRLRVSSLRVVGQASAPLVCEDMHGEARVCRTPEACRLSRLLRRQDLKYFTHLRKSSH
jgi:hypothetical protein